jgi:uncharacterized protein (DUF2249 family)
MVVEPSASPGTSPQVSPQSEPSGERPAERADALRDLTALFGRALRRLGQAGHVEEASRLAGKAYVLLRHPAPDSAEHINGVMHYLARLPQDDPTDKDTTMSDPQLDVRSEPHGRRHELILSTYHELTPGDGFVLVNDHDPKPLYYQFDAQMPGQFTWDYLEQGPEVWKVRIGRAAS